MPRLRRSDCSSPGITRRGAGRGFSYRWPDGTRVTEPGELERIRALGIPPAWKKVWICTYPHGHIQATGMDAAGRRQYVYHPHWRRMKDQQKYDHILDFGAQLARVRGRVTRDLRLPDPTAQRALAAAFRIMDLGAVRIGSEQYADTNGSFGVATLQVRHVSVGRNGIRFRFPGKSGQEWDITLHDDDLAHALRPLVRGRGAEDVVLAWRGDDEAWHPVRSAQINDYIHQVMGDGFTAKDFRTWKANVTVALALARANATATSPTARKKAVSAAIREASENLGNTPAIARASYVDPRLVDAFMSGDVIAGGTRAAAERQVLELLGRED